MTCFRTAAALLSILLLQSSANAQPQVWSHGELNWHTIETEHFFVHYHDNPLSELDSNFTGPERTARVIAKIAEEIHDPVTALYQHEPNSKVHFVVRDTEDYSNGGAYYYDNKIQIWATYLDFDLRGSHNWLRNVITHEYIHMIQLQASMKMPQKIPAIYVQWIHYENERRKDVLYGFPDRIVSWPFAGTAVPVWFAEGSAQYQRQGLDYEFWDSHRDMILRSRAIHDDLLSYTQMSTFGKNSIGNESAYNQGYAFTSFLASRYGEDALQKMSDEASGFFTTFETAMEKVTGKPAGRLYDDWQEHITTQYRTSVAGIVQNQVTGQIIEPDGIGNLYPVISPDGTRIAYASTEENDYLSRRTLVIHDLTTGKKKKTGVRVNSSLSWSPDGSRILYSYISDKNDHHSFYSDLYIFDLKTEKSHRITKSLRTLYPSFSPDGKEIVCVVNCDGSTNVVRISGVPEHLDQVKIGKPFVAQGMTYTWLTRYTDGRQCFKPVFTPDGMNVIFDTAIDDGRDIAMVGRDGGEVTFLLKAVQDERSPALSADGKQLYYSSDETGIFNVFRYTLETGEKVQLTNVLGGAFYPSVDADGNLAYSLYDRDAYRIAHLKSPVSVDPQHSIYTLKNVNVYSGAELTALDGTGQAAGYPTRWPLKAKSYDDAQLPAFNPKPYKTAFQKVSILPVARVDYGTFKPGFYFYTADLLDKSTLFGGLLMNVPDLNRDVFLILEYSGLGPTLFLEGYNQTRDTDFKENSNPENDSLVVNELVLSNKFDLLEFDIGADFSLLAPRDLRLAVIRAWYEAKVGGKEYNFSTDTFDPVPEARLNYYKGTNFVLNWKYNSLRDGIHTEINPDNGFKLNLRYGYNLDELIEGFAFDSDEGFTEVYEDNKHHKLEFSATKYLKSPVKGHAIELHSQVGFIPTKVDSFFNFFAGGLIGLRGYPFYSLEGRNLFIGKIHYRFPIFRNIDQAFLRYFYLDKIYGGLHFGIGDAWTGKTDGNRIRDFKREAGFELRFETSSFYVYPTRISFDATYGFDRHTYFGATEFEPDPTGEDGTKPTLQKITVGREWRFYLTVLFGFSLFDNI